MKDESDSQSGLKCGSESNQPQDRGILTKATHPDILKLARLMGELVAIEEMEKE